MKLSRRETLGALTYTTVAVVVPKFAFAQAQSVNYFSAEMPYVA